MWAAFARARVLTLTSGHKVKGGIWVWGRCEGSWEGIQIWGKTPVWMPTY